MTKPREYRTCRSPECSAVFSMKKSNAVYCSKRCRDVARRRKLGQSKRIPRKKRNLSTSVEFALADRIEHEAIYADVTISSIIERALIKYYAEAT